MNRILGASRMMENMDDQFKDFQKDFNNLKEDYKSKKITEDEYRRRLKRLQLKDRKGRSWTIGAQTGKWYCYDGQQWMEAAPPTFQDKRAICIYCGFENNLEDEVCVNCGGNVDERPATCDQCGMDLDEKTNRCPSCSSPPENMSTQDEFERFALNGPYLVVKKFDPVSLFFFLGGLGSICGIVLGAFAGTTNFFPGIERLFPLFLAELQGGLYGGIVYSLLGGILGFLGIGFLGVCSGLLMNLVIALFGGLKIRVNRLD